MARDVEQLYWDNVTLQGRINRLESQVADLERRLNDNLAQIQQTISDIQRGQERVDT